MWPIDPPGPNLAKIQCQYVEWFAYLRDVKASRPLLETIADFRDQMIYPTGQRLIEMQAILEKDRRAGKDEAGIHKRLHAALKEAGAGDLSRDAGDNIERQQIALKRLLERRKKKAKRLHPAASLVALGVEAAALWGLAYQLLHELIRGSTILAPLIAFGVALGFALIVKSGSSMAFQAVRQKEVKPLHRVLAGLGLAIGLCLPIFVVRSDANFLHAVLRMRPTVAESLAKAIGFVLAFTMVVFGNASAADSEQKQSLEDLEEKVRQLIRESSIDESIYQENLRNEAGAKSAWLFLKRQELEMRRAVNGGLDANGKLTPEAEARIRTIFDEIVELTGIRTSEATI